MRFRGMLLGGLALALGGTTPAMGAYVAHDFGLGSYTGGSYLRYQAAPGERNLVTFASVLGSRTTLRVADQGATLTAAGGGPISLLNPLRPRVCLAVSALHQALCYGPDPMFVGAFAGDGDDTVDARGLTRITRASAYPGVVLTDRHFLDAGDDVFIGGSAHDDVNGGPGNDRITGGGGRDELMGDDGDDVLSYLGGSGFGSVHGGRGADQITIGADLRHPLHVAGAEDDDVVEFRGTGGHPVSSGVTVSCGSGQDTVIGAPAGVLVDADCEQVLPAP